jgi:predicted metal-dependent hydrolase
MQDKDHKDLAYAILNAIREINPYNSNNQELGYLFAAGFLASYLASLAEEDPYIYKRYMQHIKTKGRDR